MKVPTPFLDTRMKWNSALEHAYGSLRVWRVIGVAGMMGMTASLAGWMQFKNAPRYLPYVIAIDSNGRTQVVGPAQPQGMAEGRATRTFLADWVMSARMITADAALEQKAMQRVYDALHANDKAKHKMDEAWAPSQKDRFPLSRAANETVDVEVETPQPVAKDAWQVYWTETVRDRDGAIKKGPTKMRATLQVYTMPELDAPRDAASLLNNPLGLYVEDWDPQEVPNQ